MNFLKLTLIKAIPIDNEDNSIWININKMLCYESYQKGGSVIVSDNGESRFLVKETPDNITAKITSMKFRSRNRER